MTTPSSTELLSLLESVERGAHALDDYLPEWYDKLDLDRLDVGDYRNCVLSQLFNDDATYDWNCGRIGVTDQASAVRCGFHAPPVPGAYKHLTRFWSQQVRIRRAFASTELALELAPTPT